MYLVEHLALALVGVAFGALAAELLGPRLPGRVGEAMSWGRRSPNAHGCCGDFRRAHCCSSPRPRRRAHGGPSAFSHRRAQHRAGGRRAGDLHIPDTQHERNDSLRPQPVLGKDSRPSAVRDDLAETAGSCGA
ncbi:hypothetical protein [Streptomyces sp. SLBN-118]|uniref:hypothetical protein n=1 Tax=Streptomyces sp. SLBN-118 TaxID=2768454 RepID=UPI00114F69AD|nr:hypothetical protein [Streptomyces sp. SLBN-118]